MSKIQHEASVGGVSRIQAYLLSTKDFIKRDVESFIERNDLLPLKVHKTENFWRLRMIKPKYSSKIKYRTKVLCEKPLIKAVVII